MPYLTNHYDIDERIVERAEALFERIIGYQLAATEYSEVIQYNNKGGFLGHTPVNKLISVKAKTDDWGMDVSIGKFLGETSWVDINLDHVVLHQKDDKSIIVLPATIFGSQYSHAEVTYEAGLADIPEDIQSVILEIALLIQKGEVNEWDCLLPHHIHDVIDKYRKRAID